MGHTFIVTGKPVPAARMTQKTKFTPQARRSLEYQDRVGWCAKFARVPTYENDVKLTVKIFLNTRGRADLSNYIKAIEDGMQYARVIKDDKQVIGYGPGTGILIVPSEERVEVTIENIKNNQEACETCGRKYK